MTNLFDLSSIKTLFNLKCHERRLSVTMIMFLKCLIELLEVQQQVFKTVKSLSREPVNGSRIRAWWMVVLRLFLIWFMTRSAVSGRNLPCFGIRKNRVNQFLDSNAWRVLGPNEMPVVVMIAVLWQTRAPMETCFFQVTLLWPVLSIWQTTRKLGKNSNKTINCQIVLWKLKIEMNKKKTTCSFLLWLVFSIHQLAPHFGRTLAKAINCNSLSRSFSHNKTKLLAILILNVRLMPLPCPLLSYLADPSSVWCVTNWPTIYVATLPHACSLAVQAGCWPPNMATVAVFSSMQVCNPPGNPTSYKIIYKTRFVLD